MVRGVEAQPGWWEVCQGPPIHFPSSVELCPGKLDLCAVQVMSAEQRSVSADYEALG